MQQFVRGESGQFGVIDLVAKAGTEQRDRRHAGEPRQVRDADAPKLFTDMVAFWEKWIVAKPPLRFPERKVQEYLVANTINNLLTIDLIGDDLIVNVNKFHYHAWYGGGREHPKAIVALQKLGGELGEAIREEMKAKVAKAAPDGYTILFVSSGYVVNPSLYAKTSCWKPWIPRPSSPLPSQNSSVESFPPCKPTA